MSIPEEAAHVDDRRANPFFIVDTAVVEEYMPHIGATGLALYALLCRHADKQRACFPGTRYLSAKLGIGRATLFRTIERLVKVGLVERLQRRAVTGARLSTTYILLPVRRGWFPGETGGGSQVRRGSITTEPEVDLKEVDSKEVTISQNGAEEEALKAGRRFLGRVLRQNGEAWKVVSNGTG